MFYHSKKKNFYFFFDGSFSLFFFWLFWLATIFLRYSFNCHFLHQIPKSSYGWTSNDLWCEPFGLLCGGFSFSHTLTNRSFSSRIQKWFAIYVTGLSGLWWQVFLIVILISAQIKMISSFFLYNFHNFLGCKLCLCVNHIRSTIYSQLSMANFLSSFPSINQNLNSLELFTTTKGIRKTTLQTEIPLFALFFFLFLFFNIFKFNTNYKIHKKNRIFIFRF